MNLGIECEDYVFDCCCDLLWLVLKPRVYFEIRAEN